MRAAFSLFVILLLTNSTAFSQGFGGGGSGAANHSRANSHPRSESPSPNRSELLAVSGTALLSIKPESLRLVFGVTADEETSQACAATVKKAISAIRKSAAAIDIAAENVVEDFIIVEPTHEWEPIKVKFKSELEEGEDEKDDDDDDDDVGKLVRETPSGFRMQTNLLVLCKDEQQALEVMNIAFDAGVNDIISFDYWHSDIDKHKKEALKKAVEQAKLKAEILLAVFDEKPSLLNVSSSAYISYPQEHYQTIEPDLTAAQRSVPYSWRNYGVIRAFRPRITFYAGSKEYADLSPTRPAMTPEISVSSTVTLTYGSPARDEALELSRLSIEAEAKSKK